jgi:hypothetical protein
MEPFIRFQFRDDGTPRALLQRAGGYRIILEFYCGSHEAVDGKYEELVGFGYRGHHPPYDVTPTLHFAFVDDRTGTRSCLRRTATAPTRGRPSGGG